MKVRKAVIPAAGLGTRFLPATKALAKEMLPIVDKPTIQFIVEEAKASGIEDILIVEGKQKRSIEDHFDSAPELEQNLKENIKMPCWSWFTPPLTSALISSSFASHIRAALGMPFVWRSHSLATNHLLSCSAMT